MTSISEERLRHDAMACFRAAVGAVDPARLVDDFLKDRPESLPPRGKVFVAAIGKAAPAMAGSAWRALGDRIADAIAIVPPGQVIDLPANFKVYEAGHPIPDEEGKRGAGAVLGLAEVLGPDDVFLVLISGGGSALMTLPAAGLTIDDVQVTTDALIRSGATIQELNTVRKHFDQLKGGRLAAAARPARVVAPVLSDVVGDPLDVIASGPVSPDPTTFADAVTVLARRGLADRVPPEGDKRGIPQRVRLHLERGLRGEIPETPKPDDPCFDRVEARVIGNNRRAAVAALAAARRHGYRTMLLTTFLTGEAREAGRALASVAQEVRSSGHPLSPPACLVAAGETTVTVRSDGLGGRNQEVALGAALALDGAEGILVASVGTDGIDGPTAAAGALGWGSTVRRAGQLGLDPERALAAHDTYPFFEALGDLIVTGPTGTNVMDLVLILIAG